MPFQTFRTVRTFRTHWIPETIVLSLQNFQNLTNFLSICNIHNFQNLLIFRTSINFRTLRPLRTSSAFGSFRTFRTFRLLNCFQNFQDSQRTFRNLGHRIISTAFLFNSELSMFPNFQNVHYLRNENVNTTTKTNGINKRIYNFWFEKPTWIILNALKTLAVI